jgi:hypothetical protein
MVVGHVGGLAAHFGCIVALDISTKALRGLRKASGSCSSSNPRRPDRQAACNQSPRTKDMTVSLGGHLRRFLRAGRPGSPVGDNDDRIRQAFIGNTRVPLGLALLVAVAFPAAFFASAPSLRTTLGAVWLVGAGIIMGWITYYDRRAAPYLSDRPSIWAMGRKLRRLDPSRYAEGGRTFVHRETLGIVVLTIWWIGVGPLLLFR